MATKKPKYKNLSELAAAFKAGKLKNYKLILDNDDSRLVYDGSLKGDDNNDEKNDECANWYRGNGYADLQEACEAAGIPCEWC